MPQSKYGFELGHGQSHADLPLLSLRGMHVRTAILNFSRKLFCALYYKHAQRILLRSGGIAVRWFSNLQVEADEIPRELANVLVGFPRIERSNMNLDGQFFYRWGVADTGEVAAFLTLFRRSFAIVGYVHQRADEFELPDSTDILRPYAHDAQPVVAGGA